MLNLIFILMIIMAIATIQTPILRHAVLYLAVFSLLCSFAYLLYQAPDVAIAEAVIGCTLSTVLYLVALKKYTIFRVYYCNHSKTPQNQPFINAQKNSLVSMLQTYLINIELELDLINTTKSVKDLESSTAYDIIIEHSDKAIIIHGAESNYHFEGFKDYCMSHPDDNVTFMYIKEPEEMGEL